LGFTFEETMHITLVGRHRGPVIATVGTWDPVGPEAERLLARLLAAARTQGIGSAAVLLDPPPKVHLEGAGAYPLFHDSARRIDLVRRSGVDLVVRVGFAREDLYGTAADFFAAVCPQVEVDEFWLRPGQDLGRDLRGSELAVSLVCRARGIRFRVLPADPVGGGASKARWHLSRGELVSVGRIAGCQPSVRRPDGGYRRLAWPAGAYSAVDPHDSLMYEVVLEPDPDAAEGCRLRWPERGPDVLEFVRGPGDRAELAGNVAPALVESADPRRQTLIKELFHASGSPG
jgi:hypothetical protein